MTPTPLTLEEGYILREFLDSPAHRVLTRHLQQRMGDALSRLMGPDPETNTAHLLHWRGVYEGFVQALNLPEQVIRMAGLEAK